MSHKAGYINIIGNPNVGKSTLMNALIGEDLSITTPKAQTTRHRILGIRNEENYQMIFSDTPGVLEPAYALQENMMDFVRSVFEDADVILYMVEAGEKMLKDPAVFKRIRELKIPLIVVINKMDTADQEKIEHSVQHWHEQLPGAEILPLSALHKFNIEMLLSRLEELLPESPPYFGKDQISDRQERFFVQEIIREQILLHYSKEIPYSVEVEVTSFSESEDINHISAVIYTERNTQKGILVGKGGSGIKRVGTLARKKMEAFFDKKVFLEMHVKVRKNWRQSPDDLKRFGYR